MGTILKIALANTGSKTFDYLPVPAEATPPVGARVSLPFGKKNRIGVIIGHLSESEVPYEKLKAIHEKIDDKPLISNEILDLCLFASGYYHYPFGDLVMGTLPKALRQGKIIKAPLEKWYSPSNQPPIFSARESRKKALFDTIQAAGEISEKALKASGITTLQIKTLLKTGAISLIEKENLKMPTISNETPLDLNAEQRKVVEAVEANKGYQAILVQGITGSGKTEVYMQIMSDFLKNNQQCLILVPEIGLTPQTLKRFEARFQEQMLVLHSGLSEEKRALHYMLAASGKAKIIIGTRSALFTPLPDLGLIIIDEEHDPSFKSQTRCHYHARDLALYRAYKKQIPILLGSATPSLESLFNAQKGKYLSLSLSQRAGLATLPLFQIIDLRKEKSQSGLSAPLKEAIDKTLSENHQVLLFINRRGYAPVLLCKKCGWLASCPRCDAKLTVHHQPRGLFCHHCALERPLWKDCPACHASPLETTGIGTEKMEMLLKTQYPEIPVLRIDRDSTQKKGSLEGYLRQIAKGGPQILIGTQMLAKGHHFPLVTLVGIIDGDSGFFSSDFRASERMGQLLTQVAGRAGREEKQGLVMIQTYQAEEPKLLSLIQKGYFAFAAQLLKEREGALWPPFSSLAILRARATHKTKTHAFLNEIKQRLSAEKSHGAQIYGPIPSLMEKKANQYHAHCLIHSPKRHALQSCMKQLDRILLEMKQDPRIHYAIDVDPIDILY